MDNEMVIKDKFTDYAGVEHRFVVAVRKVNLKEFNVKTPTVIDLDGLITLGGVNTGLQVGIAICNPIDEYDEYVGVLKALGRARKADCSLYTTFPGQLGTAVMQAYLEQEAQYIKNNPDKYIKGYKEAKENFFKAKEMEKLENNLTDMEKAIVEGVKKNPNFLDNVHTYLNYLGKKFTKCTKK